MNYAKDLTTEQKNLIMPLGIIIENKEYSEEEVKRDFNTIFTHIMSMSSKNGDLAKELNKYNEVTNIMAKKYKF